MKSKCVYWVWKWWGRIRSELKLEPSCGYKTSFCAKRVLAVSWQTADFKVLWWSWFQPLAQEPKTLFYAWAQYMSTFVLKVCLWVLKNKKNRPALVTRVGWGRVHIVQVSLTSPIFFVKSSTAKQNLSGYLFSFTSFTLLTFRSCKSA